MRMQTPKLAGLGRLPFVIAEPTDSEVLVPSVMVDAAAIPFALTQKDSAAPGSLTIGDTISSTISAFNISRAAAAAAQTTRLFVLKEGLWQIEFDWMWQLPSGVITRAELIDVFGSTTLGLTTNTIFTCVGLTSPGVTWIQQRLSRWMLIPAGQVWRLDAVYDNTGGTSQMQFQAHWVFNKYA